MIKIVTLSALLLCSVSAFADEIKLIKVDNRNIVKVKSTDGFPKDNGQVFYVDYDLELVCGINGSSCIPFSKMDAKGLAFAKQFK